MELEKRLFGNEWNYVQEVLETDFRSSKGSMMMKRLEDHFAAAFQSKYAISHINGTATMHSLLEALGIGEGDEVIVPPLTMSSTTFVVLQCNATPVFADINPRTFEIDPQSIAKNITERTKAIITVSLYGLSPDMDPIMDLARRKGIKVIEDNAECFLGRYKGRLVGTIGDAASFSFQSSKHLTSGEGGMVITNDLELAENVRRVSSLGYAGVGASKGKITKKDIQDPNYSRHVLMGWNYRMPELCAAVALAQMENIEALVARRIEAAKLLDKAAASCSWLRAQETGPEYEHSYWTYVLKLEHPEITWHQFRDKFLELGGDGIYAAWKLTYLEPMFQNRALLGREKYISEERKRSYTLGLCPQAEAVQPRLLQFKTNYWNIEDAVRQAEILAATIEAFA